ncbi:unnamed protein product [Dicrocoelium dendriticum]|nr:unnamed protein product [Dicrocoelium dendriticum]
MLFMVIVPFQCQVYSAVSSSPTLGHSHSFFNGRLPSSFNSHATVARRSSPAQPNGQCQFIRFSLEPPILPKTGLPQRAQFVTGSTCPNTRDPIDRHLLLIVNLPET